MAIMTLLITMTKRAYLFNIICCLSLIFMLCSLTVGQTDQPETPKQPSLAALLRENTYPFQITDGRLSGPGEKFLIDSMKDVQFVAYGEEHNRRAVHQFGNALFRLLHEKFGFNYLALEEDPYWGKMLSKAARESGAKAVLELTLRYPNAFHLLSEEEMEMIGNIGSLSKTKSAPIWGLNQVFAATHIYARLVEIAPNKKARETAQRLLDQSLEYEKERFQKNVHYLSQVAKPEDFELLRSAFQPAANSEAVWLIGQIELSQKIFAPYATKPSPPAEVFYESGKMRETNMKYLFAEGYREAQAGGEVLPKVLAMFGQLHLYRGLSERTELYTLGNFLSETAIFNRQRSFHIYSTVNRPWTRTSFFAELVHVAAEATGDSASGVIIDLRPLFDYARRDKNIDPQLRRLIIGFDAFLFLKDGEAGSIERLKTPKFNWYPNQN